MKEDDFDLNEFMGGSDDLEKKLEMYREKMIEDAIYENYRRITENGLSEFHMRHLVTSELIALKQLRIQNNFKNEASLY